jgi:hypothetical protein
MSRISEHLVQDFECFIPRDTARQLDETAKQLTLFRAYKQAELNHIQLNN